jgi:hypothetical protein
MMRLLSLGEACLHLYGNASPLGRLGRICLQVPAFRLKGQGFGKKTWVELLELTSGIKGMRVITDLDATHRAIQIGTAPTRLTDQNRNEWDVRLLTEGL